jgi:hypothetical protein
MSSGRICSLNQAVVLVLLLATRPQLVDLLRRRAHRLVGVAELLLVDAARRERQAAARSGVDLRLLPAGLVDDGPGLVADELATTVGRQPCAHVVEGQTETAHDHDIVLGDLRAAQLDLLLEQAIACRAILR